MRIEEVTEQTLTAAGYVHAESWRASHRDICSPEFVAAHTARAQTEYLRREQQLGKRVFLMTDREEPVGIVSVWDSVIENLYVLPGKQGRGYGSRLLKFAMTQCRDIPTLWVLNSNENAHRLYLRHGFLQTGVIKYLNDTLLERELRWDRLFAIRQAERISHEKAYAEQELFAPGSWLAKPVRTVLELLPRLEERENLRVLDLGCGVGRNAIPVAKAFPGCSVDCVDILPAAIEKLEENAVKYGVSGRIRGILSGIDQFAVEPSGYDLILAVSALEHMDSQEAMLQKLAEIREGVRSGGIVCLIMNSGVVEWDQQTGTQRAPQFEINLPTERLRESLSHIFTNWEVLRSTVVPQKYDIPRETGVSCLETSVVTLAVRRGRA